MKASWMRDIVIGQKHKNLVSQREFTVEKMDWARQKVTLRTKYDDHVELLVERFYEYYA